MTSYQIVHLYTLLLLVVFGTSCNAQIRKDLPKEKVGEPKTIADCAYMMENLLLIFLNKHKAATN